MKKEKNFPPILETERLILRPINLKDAESIFEYVSDVENTKFMLWNTHKSLDETISFINFENKKYKKKMCYDYAFVLKNNNKLIGTGGCFNFDKKSHKVEIGYIINKIYWGQGLVVEAMIAVINYMFNTLNIHKICGMHFVENINSGKVMQKLGMKFEGRKIDDLIVRGEFISIDEYGLINPKHEK